MLAISDERRQYALRYRNERDQRLCVAAYRLLQQALLQEFGIDERPVLVYDSKGKPLLAGHPGIHFSLSHCHAAVACAVSNRPVGIDIETPDHYSPEVARRVMNDDELREIEASAQPQVAFTRLWTMKESFYKLTGNDANGDTPHLLVGASRCHFSTIVHPSYVCTVCQE
ncbi:MAG: 4'-phosphopantetheinyl transferase superfamily protein [Muribaculaceae bacterium]|nr:4'-phosphopantetheinyl transferase superfamily protein [Muribaculaceae bacterium]